MNEKKQISGIRREKVFISNSNSGSNVLIDIVEIPDVEEDSGAGHNKAILSPLVTNVIKVQDLAAITKSVRQVTLPIPVNPHTL